MGRSTYNQSISSSTRTFQTAPPADAPVTPREKRKYSFPKLPIDKLRRPLVGKKQLPWVLVAGLIIISMFLFGQYRQAQTKLHGTAAAAEQAKQVSNTLAKVASIAVVPTDETPTVVTVADPSKLSQQTFFAKAQVGDKVIVYSKAKQALLYRPSTNQIVTMAPVTDSQPQ